MGISRVSYLEMSDSFSELGRIRLRFQATAGQARVFAEAYLIVRGRRKPAASGSKSLRLGERTTLRVKRTISSLLSISQSSITGKAFYV
jgi:hypothetical protein